MEELLPDSETARRLLSQIHTYVKAKRQHCNAENYASDGMTDAFYAYLRACGFDINGADLLLRSIYFDTDKKNGYGFAYAETNTEFYRVGLIPYKNAVKLCDHIRDGSHVRKITDNDIQAIDSFYDEATGRASSCVFVVSESEN